MRSEKEHFPEESFKEKRGKLAGLREARNHVKETLAVLRRKTTEEKFFREIIAHEDELRAVIERRIQELRERYSILVGICARPGKGVGRQDIEIEREAVIIKDVRRTANKIPLDLIMSNITRIRTQRSGTVEAGRVLEQAEIILLIEKVAKEMLSNKRKWNGKTAPWIGRNPRIEELFEGRPIEFPIVFQGGYDYFDRPDLFSIEQDDENKNFESAENQRRMR